MPIRIITFGALQDFFEKEFELEVPAGATGQDVLTRLSFQNPSAGSILSVCKIAIAGNLADPKQTLASESELFLLPPPSGG